MSQRIIDLVSALKGKGDLVVCAKGATVRIKETDLIATHEGISVYNTGIQISAADGIAIATSIPTAYPVDADDVSEGRAIVLSYGDDRSLFSVAQCTPAMMAYIRARIVREIELMARIDNMLLIGTSLEGETLHRTMDLSVDSEGIDLENHRILSWDDINATHADEHLLVSYGNNQILTFATGR